MTQTYAARGLWTYPNNFSEVPDGAFSRADDAVIRREGIIETRRGFQPTAATYGSSGDRLRSMGSFTGMLVGHTSADKVVRYSGGAFTEYSGTYTPPTGHRMRFLQTAKSLYFTTNAGVKRLDEQTGTVYSAGVPQALGGTLTANVGAHATGFLTISGGSGTLTATINGTAVAVTWGTSDNATASALSAAINANTTTAALVVASVSGGTPNRVDLSAKYGGSAGNSITLAVSGTGLSASGSALSGGTDVSGAFLPADSQTAYRFVWGLRNANDRVILGAPSGRLALTNAATETSASVALAIQVPDWVTADHFLQVYRADASGGATIPAGEDMGLVYETYPTATDMSTGTLTFTDVTPDELKGAALYSSPNAGVPGSEKFQPPVCVDLAEYKGRVWCAATTQRQRLFLTLMSVDTASGGMALNEGIIITDGTTTERYVASTVEDSVGIPTVKYFLLGTTGTAAQNVETTAESMVRVINAASSLINAYYVSGEYDSPGQVVLEAKNLGALDLSIRAYQGPANFWTPALAYTHTSDPDGLTRSGNTVTSVSSYRHGFTVGQQIDVTTTNTAIFPSGRWTVSEVLSSKVFRYTDTGSTSGMTATGTFNVIYPSATTDESDAPNTVAYAESGEGADAVPLGNYMPVGGANFAVLRTIPLGDTLFIFKEDGTYILTGDTPETFSVRAYPNPAILVAPESAVVLGNAIYALTNQGVMAFTESGAQLVSRPIEGTLATFYAGSEALKDTTKSVAFGVSYETEREYHLFLPASSSDTYATQAYVYNYVTKAWTRWTLPATTGYVLPSDGLEYLGNYATNTVRVERKTRTSDDYQDATGTGITMAVDWQVRTAGDPSAYKHWQKVTVMLETPAPTSVLMSLGTELSATRSEGTMPTEGLPYITTYVPEEQSRSQTLTVGVSAGQAGQVFALKGLAVDIITSSTSLR